MPQYELHPTGVYKVQITDCTQSRTKKKIDDRTGQPKPTYPMLVVELQSESGNFTDWIVLEMDYDLVQNKRTAFYQALGYSEGDEFAPSDLIGRTLFAEVTHEEGKKQYAGRTFARAEYSAINPDDIPF